MENLLSFDIKLAKQPPVFFSNQCITGTVIIELSSAMVVNGIAARIYGRSFTKIEVAHTTSVDDTDDKSTTHQDTEILTEEEVYLDHCLNLLSNARMPSSFEHGSNCNIRYEITASISRKEENPVHSQTKMITVLECIDINQASLTQRPYPQGDETKFPRTCCCSSGPVKLTACVDRNGYCPGEGVILDAKCENLSSRTVDCIKLRLFRYVTWFAQGRSQRAIKCYYEHESRSKVLPGHLFNWQNEIIYLPAVPPTIQSSSLISVTYELMVFAIVSTDDCLHISLPFIIGTVPMQMQCQSQAESPLQPSIPGSLPSDSQILPSNSSTRCNKAKLIPQMLSYIECIDGFCQQEENLEETSDDNNKAPFVPLYTFATNYKVSLQR
ncbi:expressed hypothetical protein [Trichoplax adhaerens]|uniref:Arrestin C-terminal-like domain-containing protein n=1 Tax=Trichoplax adhaerens TaxID=10228 RepID=B3S6W7_TRIAD|nr:expressed hypothetical protein [Trichoplax adhaerens]EDV21464.1 expressed hypothetical protein [Trichoplax adhaerens]|eukprot:XP_002116064.1 expressed hypothetical protein [Trichoplax adhaerens]